MEEEGKEEIRPAWRAGAFPQTCENTTVPQKLPAATFPPAGLSRTQLRQPGPRWGPGVAPASGREPHTCHRSQACRTCVSTAIPNIYPPKDSKEESVLQQGYKSPGKKSAWITKCFLLYTNPSVSLFL